MPHTRNTNATDTENRPTESVTSATGRCLFPPTWRGPIPTARVRVHSQCVLAFPTYCYQRAEGRLVRTSSTRGECRRHGMMMMMMMMMIMMMVRSFVRSFVRH